MRLIQLSVGVLAYAAAIAALLVLFGFIAGIGPHGGLNDGPPTGLASALAINVGLIALFGLHHSGAARQGFKSWLAEMLPPDLERSVYLLTTAALVALLIVVWRPIPITLWHVENPVITALFRIALLGVMAMMLVATFQIGHLGFFGLRKPLDAYLRQRTPPGAFSARLLYGLVRHPISVGWLVAPWLVPEFTLGQLVFALGTAAYIFAVTPLEEADLRREVGPQYDSYRAQVPAFFPFVRGVTPDRWRSR
ncbi:MAG: isoprenylcysteine carboxylmethyltransferase family protein [Pseudomonadota bacterium]